MSKKWDIPGEITNVRLAPDNKILSYEIRTNKGNLTTRHRSMIKGTPNIDNEANIPIIVDNPSAPGDGSATPEPAEAWSTEDRLRAKSATIHTLEADDPILKTSSPDRPRSAVEYFPSWINISGMKAVSDSCDQTATAATIPSWPSRESSDCQAATMATKPSRPDSALTEQREETQVSMTAKEGSVLLTNHTSWQSVHQGSQGGTHQSNRKFLAPWFLQDLQKFGCGQDPRIHNTMPKSSCTMMCFLGTYAVGMTIAFLVAVVVGVVTTGTCQEIFNGRNTSDFQEANTRQTNIMVDFFSEVEAKGSASRGPSVRLQVANHLLYC